MTNSNLTRMPRTVADRVRVAARRVLPALSAMMLAFATPSPAGAASAGPDAAGYTATDAAVYSFVDLSTVGGAVSVLSGVDDGVAGLTLPFPVHFYGHDYTIACVSANGALYLVNQAGACQGITDFVNTDLATTAPPTDPPSILPFWSDLSFDVPGGGAVYYQTSGDAGARKFIVQWRNAFPEGGASPVTFEVVLSEGTGRILFQYQNVDLGAAHPASKGAAATIGIRNANALTTHEQIEWSYKVGVVNDESAVSFDLGTITRTTPTLTWPTPAPLVYGTPLSSTQLNATADVPGSFTYTPPAGTVLGVGSGQPLSVVFTPTDSVRYTTANAGVTISVAYNTAVGHVFLQPINNTSPRSSFKAGSTIPVKFQLFLADGVTPVSTATATLRTTQTSTSCPTTVNETSESAKADGGTAFKYDASSQTYVYNLGTGKTWCGTYRLDALLNDGSTISATVEVRNK